MASYVATPLTLELAEQIARNLSPRDRAEVLAYVWPRPGQSEDMAILEWAREQVAETKFVHAQAWAIVSAKHGEAVAMGGIKTDPGMMKTWLASTWCVGTPERTSVVQAGIAVFRQAKLMHREWAAKPFPVRKSICMCLDSPGGPPSEWLERLGYSLEGILASHGCHGETFKLWGKIHGS